MDLENNPESTGSSAVEAFMAAFEANRELLLCWAISYTQNTEDAEDVLHTVLARVLRRFQGDDFDRNFNYTGYLYRSVKNNCLNFIRNRKRRTAGYKSANINDRTEPDQEERIHAAELMKIMKRTLGGMRNVMHREIFELVELKELSYLELGAKLDIPQGTVMSRVHRARKAFAQTLAENK